MFSYGNLLRTRAARLLRRVSRRRSRLAAWAAGGSLIGSLLVSGWADPPGPGHSVGPVREFLAPPDAVTFTGGIEIDDAGAPDAVHEGAALWSNAAPSQASPRQAGWQSGTEWRTPGAVTVSAAQAQQSAVLPTSPPPQSAPRTPAPGPNSPEELAPGQFAPRQFAPAQQAPRQLVPGEYGPGEYAPEHIVPEGRPQFHGGHSIGPSVNLPPTWEAEPFYPESSAWGPQPRPEQPWLIAEDEPPGIAAPGWTLPAEPECCVPCSDWQILPAGLLYRSYLAGEKEPRMQTVWLHDSDRGMVWESSLGGRVGLLRRGTFGPAYANGWQVDLEGAAQARVDPEEPSALLEAIDYRAGLLWTWRRDRVAAKVGYYHISSHLGDEFVIANPGFVRLNYVRDSAIAGLMYDVAPEVQVYGEVAYAVGYEGGAKPLELQFGAQYTSLAPTGWRGAPYAAVNGHFREEFRSDVGINAVAGWQWVGDQTGHRLRTGVQYYNGPSLQYALFDRHENLFGAGIWFDY